jgi:hypothetical protein
VTNSEGQDKVGDKDMDFRDVRCEGLDGSRVAQDMVNSWKRENRGTIAILVIIHRPVFYLNYNVSETGLLSPSPGGIYSAGSVDRASLCFRSAR